MRQKMQVNNERGLTLVEILASLIILGIVFVAFMTIFPQMSLFNNLTETKLETMNQARVVLEEYKEKQWTEKDFQPPKFKNDGEWWLDTQNSTNDIIIKVKKEPDVGPKLTEPLKDGVVRLHRLHVQLKKKNNDSSESFGYIEVK